ncbi:hypothetical protein PF011_g12106 [Phytophthora fragariae]|uniref:Uncharacterized protein n=1 Tax=Phytophthora fragariae TaxID=53985 RepID=A0A6A3KI60_9STRA|nr:hypothetical protein PF011_g12106 [Phytophthora fragariae]
MQGDRVKMRGWFTQVVHLMPLCRLLSAHFCVQIDTRFCRMVLAQWCFSDLFR